MQSSNNSLQDMAEESPVSIWQVYVSLAQLHTDLESVAYYEKSLVHLRQSIEV